MDTKEKDIERENREELRAREEGERLNTKAQSLTADGKNRKRSDTRKTNRLWLWLGVLILVIILIYWLFTIGMFEDMTGVSNG